MGIQLLDCTLRDGGFLNNWNFGYNNILTIYTRLNNANLDIIEVGFIDNSNAKDYNRSMNPSSTDFDKMFKSIKNKKSMVVAMIDYGTCDISNINESVFIDGIRIIFKKNDIDEALNFCKQIKDKGYKIFVQPVSITTYSDKNMLELIEKVNELDPYAISIVDTYGLMHKENMLKYFYLMDNNLNPNIKIGYHSHNNFQLAYSNSIELIEKRTKRDLIIDGSLLGMGKSAGNTCLELLAMYLNDNYDKNYDVNEILEVIDINILKYKKEYEWGYSLPFYLSASNDCHPKYVTFLRNKNTLAVKSINNILKNISPNKKLTYDKKYIEQLYIDYQKNDIDDSGAIKCLKNEIYGRDILLLGPGLSIIKQKNKILNYINNYNPIIISINHISNIYNPHYVFISNTKRYEHYVNIFLRKNNTFKIIATSNIIPINDEFDFILNYGKLLNSDELIGDNSMSMLITAFKNMSIKKLVLGGFDGFDSSKKEYFDDFLSFANEHKDVDLFNEAIAKQLQEYEKFMNIEFITESKYKNNNKVIPNV